MFFHKTFLSFQNQKIKRSLDILKEKKAKKKKKTNNNNVNFQICWVIGFMKTFSLQDKARGRKEFQTLGDHVWETYFFLELNS